MLDGAIPVKTEDALEHARAAAAGGLLVGISTGANLAGVRQLVASRPEAKGAAIVTFVIGIVFQTSCISRPISF